MPTLMDPFGREQLPVVVVVSRDPEQRARLRETLAARGLSVLTPPTLGAALSRVHQADLVVLDVVRPAAELWSLCGEIRRRYSSIPIVALYTAGDEASLAAGTDLGVDDYVGHDTTSEEVLARVESRLRTRRALVDLASSAARHRVLVDSAQAGLFILQDGWFVYGNPRFAELFGYSTRDICTLGLHHLVLPEDGDVVGPKFARWMEGSSPTIRQSFRGVRKNGGVIHVEVHATRTRIDGRSAFVGTVFNVGRRWKTQEALLGNENYFRALIEGAMDIITVIARDGTILYESPSVEAVLGYAPDALLGRNLFDTVHPSDRRNARATLNRILQTPSLALTMRYRVRDRQGAWRVLEATGRDLLEVPAVGGIVINSRDITKQQAAEEALRGSEERFRLLVEGSEQAFFYVQDAARRFTYLSPSVAAVLGYSPRELVGRRHDVVLLKEEPDAQPHAPREDAERTGQPSTYTVRARHRAGHTVALELVETPLLQNGEASGRQGFARDVSDRERMEAELRKAAFNDFLTELPNRVLFAYRLTQAAARAARHPEEPGFAVLYLDLDRFKVVNDSLGHSVGDDLLVAVARRLQHHMRPEDTIARFGGDEFAVLLEGVTGTDCTRVAQRILDELAAPFDLHGHEVFTSASIGIVVASASDDGDPEQLLRSADMAMYRAKASGGSQYEIYDREMQAEAVKRLRMETELRHAVERGEMVLHYQPIVELEGGRLRGFEALVRWLHPERGMIPPGEFIGIAEETGHIVALGKWVIEAGCRQLREWRDATGDPSLFVAVNLSSRQLRQPDIVDHVRDALDAVGLDGCGLKLEITESMVVEHTERVSRTLDRLKQLGVQLFMDDFGTGYASLSYLHSLPLDGLKIDRSFVSQMHTDHRRALLVESMVTLAKGLGMTVVAEGIEEEVHLRMLAEFGCDHGQGYHFSRPVDSLQAGRLLLRAAEQAVA